jgi:hypothetical protein
VTQKNRLALFTTVYPGVEKYLPAWHESVVAQSDSNFDLWIAVDMLTPKDVIDAIGTDPDAQWIEAILGDTPAQIRQTAIQLLVDIYPAVIFVDSDDLLFPSRVKAARSALESNNVYACAMTIIDESGSDLGLKFQSPTDNFSDLLPTANVFGLSNTAYRSETLKACLPIPADCVMVDWLLATRAWADGATLHFDQSPHMAYRQYAENTARVLPPFTVDQILLATERVIAHYEMLFEARNHPVNEHHVLLSQAEKTALQFQTAITSSRTTLNRYLIELNTLPSDHVWWSCVAHPKLENVWKN